jgi:hypothetical protein
VVGVPIRRQVVDEVDMTFIQSSEQALIVDRPQLPPSIQREQAIAPAVSMTDKAVSGL